MSLFVYDLCWAAAIMIVACVIGKLLGMLLADGVFAIQSRRRRRK